VIKNLTVVQMGSAVIKTLNIKIHCLIFFECQPLFFEAGIWFVDAASPLTSVTITQIASETPDKSLTATAYRGSTGIPSGRANVWPRSNHLVNAATIPTNSMGSIGFAKCTWNPASIERLWSSSLADAVRAMARLCFKSWETLVKGQFF
jgi:hypothetical protein